MLVDCHFGSTGGGAEVESIQHEGPCVERPQGWCRRSPLLTAAVVVLAEPDLTRFSERRNPSLTFEGRQPQSGKYSPFRTILSQWSTDIGVASIRDVAALRSLFVGREGWWHDGW